MSTEITQLQDNADLQLDSSDNNSKIVDEILSEMNSTNNDVMMDETTTSMTETVPTPAVSLQAEPTGMGLTDIQSVVNDPNTINTQQLNHQIDPSVNMNVVNDLNPVVVPAQKQNIVMNIETTQNFLESLTYRLQDPLLYIVVSIIMFSPMVQKSLGRILPTIFNSTLGIAPWLSVIFKSLFGSLIFFGFKNIM